MKSLSEVLCVGMDVYQEAALAAAKGDPTMRKTKLKKLSVRQSRAAEKRDNRDGALQALNEVRAAAATLNEILDFEDMRFPLRQVDDLLLRTAKLEDYMELALKGRFF